MNPKYRAWDKRRKEMCRVVSLDMYISRSSEVTIMDNNSDMHQRIIDDIELMQSTGLKDKNGVEIFEGDIVNISSHTPFSNVVEFDKEGASFMLRPVYKRWSSSYFTNYENVDKKRFEIIGNIYENSELLEV